MRCVTAWWSHLAPRAFTILNKLLLLLPTSSYSSGSPSRRLGLVCAGATQQRVVLASPVTAGNKHLLLLLSLLVLSVFY